MTLDVVQNSDVLNNSEKIELQDAKETPNYESASSTLPTSNKAVKTLRGPLKPINSFLNNIEDGVVKFVKKQSKITKLVIGLTLLVGYIAYLIVACVKDFHRARDLVYVTAFALFCATYWALKKFYGRPIWKHALKPISTVFSGSKVFNWIGIILFSLFVISWIIYDTHDNPTKLVSVAGLVVYIILGFLFSKYRDQIVWKPVLWGFALQFTFGLLILRTDVGYDFFNWLGTRVSKFLGFTNAGASFLFGNLAQNTPIGNKIQAQFAFAVLPIVVFFSSFTYLIYYLGIIQVVIKKIAWLLQVTMGTSPAESVNAAGNIFIGQTEAPLLIRPFLAGMTESELHAVMTGGFATVSGGVLGAYIKYGVSASHLLSASVMSAPAALAMSKLMLPETEEPAVKDVDDITIEKTDEKNLFEALSVGASMSIVLVANIAVMLIAFLSMLAFANEILHWLGSLVDEPDLSFEFICSYIFMPFAYLMGVEWEDSFEVAKLIGTKTFLNEFIAYGQLGTMIENRVYGRDGPKISIRSEVIATYALCGFANFGSMGVQIGGLSAIAPSIRPTLSRCVLRALAAGTMACFMTACIAGILYDAGRYDTTITASTTAATFTTIMNTTLAGNATFMNTTSAGNVTVI